MGIDQGVSYSGTIGAPGAPAYSPNYTYSYIGKWIPITIETNGNKDVESPWITFDAKTVGDLKPYADGGVGASVELGFGWDYDYRDMKLYSDFSTTYHKGTDGNGHPIPVPNDDSTIDTIVNDQKIDGGLPGYTPNLYLKGNVDIHALLSGSFQDPSFDWARQGDGQPVAGEYLVEGSTDEDANLVLNFGFPEDAEFPKSSIVGLTVTDNLDGLTKSDVIHVNWHRPYENWTPAGDSACGPDDPQGDPGDPRDCGTKRIQLSSSVAGNLADLKYNYDKDRVDFDLGSALTEGAATVGTIGIVTTAVPALEGPGAALDLVSLAMGGAASLVPTLPSPPEVHIPQTYYTYAKYKEAVEFASEGELYPDSDPDPLVENRQEYYDSQSIPGGYNEAFFDILKADFQPNDTGLYDVAYSSHTYLTGKAIYHPTKRTWDGEHYGTNGYLGQITGHTYYPSNVAEIQITWGNM